MSVVPPGENSGCKHRKGQGAVSKGTHTGLRAEGHERADTIYISTHVEASLLRLKTHRQYACLPEGSLLEAAETMAEF